MNIVVFSGAGMSAESGIQTFRDSGGLWDTYPIEEVATPEAWIKDPEKVQHFYNLRRKQIMEAEPNAAHLLVTQLKEVGNLIVITQNIDDLHERAGTEQVLHLHGNIRLAKSSGPNSETKYYPIEGWKLSLNDTCDDGFPLRPHVVWFGEEVPMYPVAEEVINNADILIIIGTSLSVYPAAGLIHQAKRSSKIYCIDPHLTTESLPAGVHLIRANASAGLQDLLRKLKEI